MQKEDIALETIPGKKPSAVSLYTEEETGDVSTTSSWTKVDSTVGSEVNVSEVSSTSEDTYRPLSTSSTSLFTDFNNKQVVDSGSETVSGVKNKNSVSGDAGNDKKPKPGLSLLGEYADSENDTEEETQRSLGTKQEKLYGVEEMSSDKIKFSNTECASTGAECYENQSSNKTVETGVMDASIEIPQAISDVCSPVEVKTEYGKDVDAHTHPDNSFAKLKRSVSKEEGQISADSDSSGSERSSESRKGSKTQKDAKKDKSKKKDKKKKKRKKRKRKHSSEKKELDATESEEKKDRKLRRSRSKEMSEKRKPLRRSRSRSRDRDLTRRRCPRSSSQDKGKRSRHLIEQSKRSRSRSTGRRSSATNRNRDLKSRSKSPKRSASPSRRRRDRGARYSPISRVRRESPSLKRKRVSRSRSPRRSSEWRKSKSPRRHTRSPDKRKRTTPDRSPGARSTPRKARSPNRRETKRGHSPPRKSSHRTSSASDSLDSGHFTNIPLSKSNKPEEHVSENKESGQKPLPHSNKSSIEKQESSIVPKPADLEKQYSPSGSPAKSWEDEFDFVFTERMSPRQGTGKSVEDVLFGTEPKTPDFKRPTPSESKKSKQKESQHTEKKEETKTEKLKGVTALADEKNKLPQTSQNQNGSSNLQSKSSLNSVEQSLSTLKDSKSGSKASKSDIKDDDDDIKKTGNDANSPQITNTHDKSAFVQSKPETIPFLDENPYVPPPVSVGTQNSDPVSQLGILGPPPANTGLLPMQALHDRIWLGLGEVGLLPAPGSQQNVNSGKNDIKKAKLDNRDQSVTRKDEGRNIFDGSPVDMEMSSPEGDIIDQMNEEFWKQQQKSSLSTTESEDSKSREETANPVFHGQSSVEEPYEPESGLVIGEESEEDLTKITDPKERRKREKQQQKEKTKVQELIDKLHRQARVEEEVKHALKAYYKHRDISKEEYKSILRRAVPQVTNSSSAIDPERIRSLVKKYVAKIKGQRVDSH